MIDILLFKSILEAKEDGYIESGDRLSIELLEMFSHYNYEKVKSLFKKNNKVVEKYYFECEHKCGKCGKVFVVNLSKTETLRYIRSYKNRDLCLCDKCREIKIKEELIKQEEAKINREEVKQSDTDSYIDLYLNPNKSWHKGIKTYRKMNLLTNVIVNWGKIQDYITDMDYIKFLQTPYWKAIAEKVRQKAGCRCQLCNSNERLNVHHRTYENHGDELHHMDDLICVCSECHEKHHFD